MDKKGSVALPSKATTIQSNFSTSTHSFVKVSRGVSVGISGLHDSNLDLVQQPSLSNQIANEPSRQSRDLIPIQQPKLQFPSIPIPFYTILGCSSSIGIIIDHPISISIQRTSSLTTFAHQGSHGCRAFLLSLDEISTAAEVEDGGIRCIGTDELDGKKVGDSRSEGVESQGTDTVGAIDDELGGFGFAGLERVGGISVKKYLTGDQLRVNFPKRGTPSRSFPRTSSSRVDHGKAGTSP